MVDSLSKRPMFAGMTVFLVRLMLRATPCLIAAPADRDVGRGFERTLLLDRRDSVLLTTACVRLLAVLAVCFSFVALSCLLPDPVSIALTVTDRFRAVAVALALVMVTRAFERAVTLLAIFDLRPGAFRFLSDRPLTPLGAEGASGDVDMALASLGFGPRTPRHCDEPHRHFCTLLAENGLISRRQFAGLQEMGKNATHSKL